MAEKNAATELGKELESLLSRCPGDAELVEDTTEEIRLSDISHSATHMLPGGVSTLDLLAEYWEDWEINYIENGDAIMYGSKSDKDVVITRTR